MSWLLSQDEFQEAASQINRGDVTASLYLFLRRLVAAVARSGTLAPALSPTGQWDEEAIDDVLQSWLTERLLAGGLQRALLVCQTPSLLSRYLERSLRNWLISKSRARSRPRLLVRLRAILEGEAKYTKFSSVGDPLDDWWGLSGWEHPRVFEGTDAELVTAAFSVGEFEPLRYQGKGRAADPVISNVDLDRFAEGVLDHLQSLLTLRLFDVAFRGRFAYAFHEETLSLDLVDVSIEEETPESQIESSELARQILAELTGRQLLILKDRVTSRLTLEQLASRYSISRGTADNELRRATSTLRRHLVGEAKPEEVLEKLIQFAFRGGGDDE